MLRKYFNKVGSGIHSIHSVFIPSDYPCVVMLKSNTEKVKVQGPITTLSSYILKKGKLGKLTK